MSNGKNRDFPLFAPAVRPLSVSLTKTTLPRLFTGSESTLRMCQSHFICREFSSFVRINHKKFFDTNLFPRTTLLLKVTFAPHHRLIISTKIITNGLELSKRDRERQGGKRRRKKRSIEERQSTIQGRVK